MTMQAISNWLFIFPLILLAGLWWMPWEKLPAKYLGPLLLLSTLGMWKTGISGWIFFIYLIAGILLSAYAVITYYEKNEK